MRGATVTATNADINVTATATTQGNGFFQIFNLPIGTYVVKVAHDGFEVTELAQHSACRKPVPPPSTPLKSGQGH